MRAALSIDLPNQLIILTGLFISYNSWFISSNLGISMSLTLSLCFTLGSIMGLSGIMCKSLRLIMGMN